MYIKLKNTSFKKETAKYWVDVSYMSNTYTVDVTFSTSKIQTIEDNMDYLSKKYDMNDYKKFKESLVFNEFEFESSFKVLITRNRISHGNPKHTFYVLPEEVLFYLFKENYQLLKLTGDLSDNIDFYINLQKEEINFIPFKSFLLIKSKESVSVEYNEQVITSTPIVNKDNVLNKI